MTAQTYRDREPGEPLAQHLYAVADLIGADDRQHAILRRAAAMSYPERPAAERIEAGRLAAMVRDELAASLAAVIHTAQARGEAVAPFNDAGAVRVKGRDGLLSLVRTEKLTPGQGAAGLAYRALYEEAGPAALGSQLGQLGETSAPRSSADGMVRHGLKRAYAAQRVTAVEAAIANAVRVSVLRAVAGEGRTIGSLSKSGHRRTQMTNHLAEDLAVAARVIAETGGLRITGS
jgi:hypothetical protein